MDVQEGKPVFDIIEVNLETVINPEYFENTVLTLRQNNVLTENGMLANLFYNHIY